jgi:hypothetical protein
MSAANFVRGGIVQARFPFDHAPGRPGPSFHYCLFVEAFQLESRQLYALCYGTSRLDEDLMAQHRGAVLSVASDYIRGTMSGGITHFVCDHVAIVAESWLKPNFTARLDFIREDRRTDARRQSLYRQFEAMEPVMRRAALDVAQHALETGQLGLPPGARLR